MVHEHIAPLSFSPEHIQWEENQCHEHRWHICIIWLNTADKTEQHLIQAEKWSSNRNGYHKGQSETNQRQSQNGHRLEYRKPAPCDKYTQLVIRSYGVKTLQDKKPFINSGDQDFHCRWNRRLQHLCTSMSVRAGEYDTGVTMQSAVRSTEPTI